MTRLRDKCGRFMAAQPEEAPGDPCPKCGDVFGWYWAADLTPPDPETGKMRFVIRGNGDGHCVACGHERAAA